MGSQMPRVNRILHKVKVFYALLILGTLGIAICVNIDPGYHHSREYRQEKAYDTVDSLDITLQSHLENQRLLGFFRLSNSVSPYTLIITMDLPIETRDTDAVIKHVVVRNSQGKVKEIKDTAFPMEHGEQYTFEGSHPIKSFLYLDPTPFPSEGGTLEVEGQLLVPGTKGEKVIRFKRHFVFKETKGFISYK